MVVRLGILVELLIACVLIARGIARRLVPRAAGSLSLQFARTEAPAACARVLERKLELLELVTKQFALTLNLQRVDFLSLFFRGLEALPATLLLGRTVA
jgi:hypothetical protein